MSRIHPEAETPERPGRDVAAAVFLRQEPDDEEEDGDGDGKEDDDEDEDEDGDGYSE